MPGGLLAWVNQETHQKPESRHSGIRLAALANGENASTNAPPPFSDVQKRRPS
jgi:hypothetical protein